MYFSVVSRLREEGWDSELAGMSQSKLDHLYGVDGVSRTTALTDRGEFDAFTHGHGYITEHYRMVHHSRRCR